MPRKDAEVMSTRPKLCRAFVLLYGVSANDKEVCVVRVNICARVVSWWWQVCVDGLSTAPFAGLSPSRVLRKESQAARVNSTAAETRARPTWLLASKDSDRKKRKHVRRGHF